MKLNRYKLILTIIISVTLLLLLGTTSNATASASINASKLNVTQGESVSINVSANAAACNLRINGAGISEKFVDGNIGGDSKTFSKAYTLNTSNPGTYTINLTGDVTDADGTQEISRSVTVKVAEKTAQSQTPAQSTQPTQPTTPAQPATPAEPTFTNANKTMYTTGNINLRSSWSTGSSATSVPAGTEVTVTGTSTQSIGGYVWYRVTYNGQTKYVASSLLTANKPEEKEEEKKEKSTNKALKDLVIENYKLTPEFDADVTKYSVEVPKDVDKLEISGITQDENAKVDIVGNDNLKVGNNIVKVTVTAEDGTTRIYTITVTKTNKEADEASSKLKLKTLEIKNATLIPNFSAEETNYTISVEDPSSIKTEDITAVAEDSDVTIKIALSEDTSSDERLITIMLEKKDGDNQETNSYQITVKKATYNPIANLANQKDNKIYYILGGIIAVLILFIIIIIILLRKTSTKYDDDYDVQDEDELDDDYDYSLKNAIDEANSEVSEELNPEFDDMVESSNVKSQILNPKDYNVFRDSGDGVGVEEETRKFDFSESEEYKSKKRGKHF